MTPTSIFFPGTSRTVSRLGFGCARIFGGPEMRATARLIETALLLGIRHFDTAPTYGLGTSEALLGDVLAGVSDVTIATKVGAQLPGVPAAMSLKQQLYRQFVRPVLARAPALKSALLKRSGPDAYSVPPVAREMTVDTLRRSLDRSEALLRRPIDMLLLHEPDALILDDAVAACFETWQRAGRIVAFGGGTGGSLRPDFAIGTVRQERYTPATVHRAGELAVYHGVLRGAGTDAPAQLAAAMAARPDAVFLVSASVPWQLRNLVRN